MKKQKKSNEKSNNDKLKERIMERITETLYLPITPIVTEYLNSLSELFKLTKQK